MSIYGNKELAEEKIKEFCAAETIGIYINPDVYEELVTEGYISESGEILLEDGFSKTINIPEKKRGGATVKFLLRNNEAVTRASTNGQKSDHALPTFKFDENEAFIIKDGKIVFDTSNTSKIKQNQRKYKYDIMIIEKNPEVFEDFYNETDKEKLKEKAKKVYDLFNIKVKED